MEWVRFFAAKWEQNWQSWCSETGKLEGCAKCFVVLSIGALRACRPKIEFHSLVQVGEVQSGCDVFQGNSSWEGLSLSIVREEVGSVITHWPNDYLPL